MSTSPSRAGSSPISASSFLIASCILLVYIAVATAQSAGPPSRPRSGEADALYADRANLASATRAAKLWRAQDTFEAAWKLARADYWLGGHAPNADRRRFLEEGIDAGRKAAALEPERPEGHFWMAANMGALAESYGLRQGIKYRGAIRDALETVLRLDAAFQHGSADRALGRWYFKVPRLFGGSHKQAETHLRDSLKYLPTSTASHFFLAELYLDDDRKAEAKTELQQVVDAPVDPEWAAEDREFKEKARRILANVR